MENLPDKDCYKPLFMPWLGRGDFFRQFAAIQLFTLVSPDRCWMLRTLAMQALHLPGRVGAKDGLFGQPELPRGRVHVEGHGDLFLAAAAVHAGGTHPREHRQMAATGRPRLFDTPLVSRGCEVQPQ